MNIAYVEHPVSADEIKSLRADGYKVIDLRFKPEQISKDDTVVTKQTETKPKTAKRLKK